MKKEKNDTKMSVFAASSDINLNKSQNIKSSNQFECVKMEIKALPPGK